MRTFFSPFRFIFLFFFCVPLSFCHTHSKKCSTLRSSGVFIYLNCFVEYPIYSLDGHDEKSLCAHENQTMNVSLFPLNIQHLRTRERPEGDEESARERGREK